MSICTHFIESPNGPIVIAEADPQLLMNKTRAAGLRKRLSTCLGGMPTLLRCRLGETFVFDGPAHLYRYGLDPVVDVLPAVRIDIEPGQSRTRC